MKRLHFLVVGILLATCSPTDNSSYRLAAENPEFIHRSIKKVTDVIVHDIFSPPVASRIYAYASVAGYEAARFGNPELISLVGQLHGLNQLPTPQQDVEYCYSLSAVQAILSVGRSLIFLRIRSMSFG